MSLVTKVVSGKFPLDNSPWTIIPQTIALVDNRPQTSGTPRAKVRGGGMSVALFSKGGAIMGRGLLSIVLLYGGLLSIGLLYGGYCP